MNLPIPLPQNNAFKVLIGLAFMAILWIKPQEAEAQYSEYEIKAALCFNFAKYVDWPEKMFQKGDNKIILSIYGSDPFGKVIDKVVRGRTLKGQFQIEVKRAYSLRDLRGSHIIFISRSERLEARKILNYTQRFRNPSILTIGDNIPGFCEAGGVLNLLDDYTFEVNPKRAENSGLLLNSRLLGIAAKTVSTEEW